MSRFLFFFIVVFSYATTDFYTYTIKLDYREYVNGKVIDRDYSSFGDILGIGVKYFNKSYLDYYLKAEIASGESIYEGATWGGEPIKNKQKGLYLLTLEGGFGSRYFYFFGGYREWNRGKSANAWDYDEVYYWGYFGIKYSYPFVFQKIIFIPEAGYKLAINPQMKVKLSNEPVLDLGSTDGGFIELPIFVKYENVYLKFFYRYQYWHINRSKTQVLILNGNKYLIFEPESITENQYLGIGVVWKF